MYIVYELWKKKASEYLSYTITSKGAQSMRQTVPLGDMLRLCERSSELQKVVLLDEQRFIWRAMPVAFCATKPCTVQDMYAVIEPFVNSYGGQASEKMFYHVDAITINGKASEYYIGKTGDIRCIVHVIMLHREDWYAAKKALGVGFDDMQVYPTSFFTLHHIKHSLQKTHGTLLYIGQHYTKRIVFQNGMYVSCEFLDLGWQVLKDIYAENNIHEFFNTKQALANVNDYAKNLISQSVRFYVDMLVRRLQSCQTSGDIFLVSDLTGHEYFMDAFTSGYAQIATGYIVPVAHMTGLKTFGKEWNAETLDIQTTATYAGLS